MTDGVQVEELEAEVEAGQRLAQRFKTKLSSAQEEAAANGVYPSRRERRASLLPLLMCCFGPCLPGSVC